REHWRRCRFLRVTHGSPFAPASRLVPDFLSLIASNRESQRVRATEREDRPCTPKPGSRQEPCIASDEGGLAGSDASNVMVTRLRSRNTFNRRAPRMAYDAPANIPPPPRECPTAFHNRPDNSCGMQRHDAEESSRHGCRATRYPPRCPPRRPNCSRNAMEA